MERGGAKKTKESRAETSVRSLNNFHEISQWELPGGAAGQGSGSLAVWFQLFLGVGTSRCRGCGQKKKEKKEKKNHRDRSQKLSNFNILGEDGVTVDSLV